MDKNISTGFAAFAAMLMLGTAAVLFATPGTVVAAGPTDEQVLVDKAQITFGEFVSAPEFDWFRDAVKDAEGILIVPDLFKGGVVFGGSGGKGVYLARDRKTGQWRGPAFYNMGSFTFGLQLGAEVAQVVILAMNDDAARAMMSPQFKLGGDVSVAAGPVGVGTAGSASLPSSAFVSFARAKGAFAGLTLEGAVVTVDTEANEAYYGRAVYTEDILQTGDARSPKASGLREAVAGPAARRE